MYTSGHPKSASGESTAAGLAFHVTGRIGEIRLERPAVLNALDITMFETLGDVLTRWRADPAIAAVTVRGSGRAFSAGGDIRNVRAAAVAGDEAHNDRLYRVEYSVNALIHAYPKPYVAVIDGICMGGGMGLAMHASQRIVTDKALLAMPETAIAFFPDIGASYVFSRLPGAIGMYLGLTATRIGAGDALYCGLATHYAAPATLTALASLEERMESAPGGDSFEAAFAPFAGPHPPSELARERAAIDRCFEGPDVGTIVGNLERESERGTTEWAAAALQRLRAGSPTAVALTFALFRKARELDLLTSLRVEYELAKRMWRRPEFLEGVRATVIDKDRNPHWDPSRIEDVDIAAIDAMLADALETVHRTGTDAAPVTPDLFALDS